MSAFDMLTGVEFCDPRRRSGQSSPGARAQTKRPTAPGAGAVGNSAPLAREARNGAEKRAVHLNSAVQPPVELSACRSRNQFQ